MFRHRVRQACVGTLPKVGCSSIAIRSGVLHEGREKRDLAIRRGDSGAGMPAVIRKHGFVTAPWMNILGVHKAVIS